MDSIWIDIASVSLVAVTKVNHHFDFSFTTPRFSYVFIVCTHEHSYGVSIMAARCHKYNKSRKTPYLVAYPS